MWPTILNFLSKRLFLEARRNYQEIFAKFRPDRQPTQIFPVKSLVCNLGRRRSPPSLGSQGLIMGPGRDRKNKIQSHALIMCQRAN